MFRKFFELLTFFFKGSFYRAYNSVRYGRFDIHPDGDRFLMVAYVVMPDSRIELVINWQQDLAKQ